MTADQNNLYKLSPPILVDDQVSFDEMLTFLKKQDVIAVDTESDSLFSYYAKVCLIQISAQADTANAAPGLVTDYLVDPLALPDINGLNELFADPEIEIIMHAAYNDILTLQKEYAFTFRNIFDTQLTARILGWQRTGLAKILEEQFDVHSDKRMQRTDWGKRPLENRQTTYAQLDTHFLLELREIQLDQLDEMNRREEALEGFAALEQVNYHERPTQERTYWQMKASRDIPTNRAGLLKALWQWREKTAQKLNRPPFKVVNDAVLVEIANTRPDNQLSLSKIRGLSQYQRQRFGKSILRTVDKGLGAPVPKQPAQKPRPDMVLDEEVTQRYEALRSWRTSKASNRGVDPDIVFSNDILLRVAKDAPKSIDALHKIAEIGPWKAKTYGLELVDVVIQSSGPKP